MVNRLLVISAVIGTVESNNLCSTQTWTAGGDGAAGGVTCGTHADLGTTYAYQPSASVGSINCYAADGTTAEACGNAQARHKQQCCTAQCSFSTFLVGAAPSTGQPAAGTGATKSQVYCGADQAPAASQAINLAVPAGGTTTVRDRPTSADIGTCCQATCAVGTTVAYVAGAGTDAAPNYYCGAGRIPVANQATTPSGATTNSGGQKTQCCNDACGKVTFKAGEGTDVTTSGSEEFYCGANKVPNESQDSLDSGSDAVGATQKTTCCSDACGKVTFKAGDGTDDSSSTTYYCGENRVPVKKQGEKASGSNSVGSGQKSVCCDDACGKVTFKAGKGTDDSSSTTYYCGENKVPVAKQNDAPSGSDSVGSGQKSKCCAAACSTVTYKAGEGTDKDTTYFCGKNQAPKKDQKTLPCDGSSCSASGKKDCCAATCASTKWAAGKKPKSPASKTMYCGDGMSPKAALADTVCAGEECAEATDAATCCEKKKVNNTTATTDAHSAGASILLLSGALILSVQ